MIFRFFIHYYPVLWDGKRNQGWFLQGWWLYRLKTECEETRLGWQIYFKSYVLNYDQRKSLIAGKSINEDKGVVQFRFYSQYPHVKVLYHTLSRKAKWTNECKMISGNYYTDEERIQIQKWHGLHHLIILHNISNFSAQKPRGPSKQWFNRN